MYKVPSMIRDARVQLVIGLLGACTLAALVWWGYRSYRHSVNEAAQLAFAVQYEQFEKIKQKVTHRPDLWAEVAAGFYKEAQAHRSSDLAPFFIAFSAQALSATGNPDIKERLQEALKGMSVSNPLYYLYKTKAAVLGVGSLKELAQDTKNPYKALAWYYLWYEAWISGNEAEASAAYMKLQGLPGGAALASYATAQMEFAA